MDKNKQSTDSFFSKKKSSLYNSKVANNLYFKDKYQDSIIDIILKKDLLKKKKYKYSDLGFYLFHDILKKEFKIDVESYFKERILQRC